MLSTIALSLLTALAVATAPTTTSTPTLSATATMTPSATRTATPTPDLGICSRVTTIPQAECDALETECDDKQPERFSDAEEAQWWVDLQGRKEQASALCKLLKDICHEDLGPSVSAKGSLGQFMKE